MIRLKNVSYCYPTRQELALDKVNLHIKKGEFLILTGLSGCGKSTLLKTLNGIIPHQTSGKFSGEVWIDGLNTKEHSTIKLAQKVGLVFQNPDEQIFSTRVIQEIAFGMENLCFSRKKMNERINWALSKVGMLEYKNSSTNALSGGQKQRIALAAVMALKPKILVLDEPLSQLDPKGAAEVLEVIKKLKDEGMTILMVEHRLHEVVKWADRVVVMDKGSEVLDIKVEDIDASVSIFRKMGLREPKSKHIDLNRYLNAESIHINKKNHNRKRIIEIRDLWYSYEYKKRRKNNSWILKGINLDIYEGEIISILGCNGSGKSTLMHNIAGIYKPQKGEVIVDNKNTEKYNAFKLAGTVGIVFQNPALMLTCDSVYEEVSFGPKNLKLSQNEIEKNVEECLEFMELMDYKTFHPQTLSGGQRLRCAAASIISMKPKIVLLDEPTSGQDYIHIKKLMEYCIELKKKNSTVIFITHDIESAVKYSDRLIIMKDGRVQETQ